MNFTCVSMLQRVKLEHESTQMKMLCEFGLNDDSYSLGFYHSCCYRKRNFLDLLKNLKFDSILTDQH